MRLLVGGDVRVDDYIKVVMRHLANITIGRLDCLGVVSVIHRLDAVVELLTRMREHWAARRAIHDSGDRLLPLGNHTVPMSAQLFQRLQVGLGAHKVVDAALTFTDVLQNIDAGTIGIQRELKFNLVAGIESQLLGKLLGVVFDRERVGLH